MKKINFAKIALMLSILAVMTLFAVSCDSLFANSNETETTAEQCTAHQASDWIIDSDPTCAAPGSKHTECTLCGVTLDTATIESLAHTEEMVEGKAPTCSEKGLTQGKKCSVCNAVLVSQSEIATIPQIGRAHV